MSEATGRAIDAVAQAQINFRLSMEVTRKGERKRLAVIEFLFRVRAGLM
jgi:hypothetical protein